MRIIVAGGGVFSKFTIALEGILKHDPGGENVCIMTEPIRRAGWPPGKYTDSIYLPIDNAFDYVLQQYDSSEYDPSELVINFGNGEGLECLQRLFKETNEGLNILSRIRFTPKLLELVSYYEDLIKFDENIIGVHIRLTDMNWSHPKYGVFSYADYEDLLDKEIELNPNSKIFVASDNEESINKLSLKYGDRMHYVPDLMRCEKEDSRTAVGATLFKSIGSSTLSEVMEEQLWLEAFLEMLLLSKCTTLIYRTSAMAYTAALFGSLSRNIKHVNL